jgi:hypothetical protein
MFSIQLIESLLFNHKLRFPSDAAINKAAHVTYEAMFQSSRTPMEQGLINLVWKHFNNLEVTQADLAVIATFDHWYEDQQGERKLMLSLEQITEALWSTGNYNVKAVNKAAEIAYNAQDKDRDDLTFAESAVMQQVISNIQSA